MPPGRSGMGSGSACTERTVTSRSCPSRASPTGLRIHRRGAGRDLMDELVARAGEILRLVATVAHDRLLESDEVGTQREQALGEDRVAFLPCPGPFGAAQHRRHRRRGPRWHGEEADEGTMKVVMTGLASATMHQTDCYNDAGWARERREENRALPPGEAQGRWLPRRRVTGQQKSDTLSTGRTSQSSSTHTHNLPAPRSSFVGREREMPEIRRALSATRLLTLTGVGGSGKTRLAVEVARDLFEAYPHGVWLVELAPLSEEVLVPKAVAEALEVPERPAEPLADTLAEVLRNRELLLILDNCEHLLEASARLMDRLLDSCPGLSILATSREALSIEGEVSWPVPPLSVPERQATPSSDELESCESVRLFGERARGRDPSFSLSPRNAFAVAKICRMLEGIPLAIELAAARVGTLSVEQISQRLGKSLELLTRGGRTALPRQRTLKGALGWSYDLLSESERKVFRRLSIFAGGWTLEASEAVGTGDGVEESEVLDLLSNLVERSLVVTKRGHEGGVRYRLLE